MSLKLSRSPIPLYVQVADLMRQRIQRQKWPAGHRLPTLDDMVAEFGVARVTIRQAMDMLEAEGVIVRRRGLGTFIVEAGRGDPPLRVATSLSALAVTISDTSPIMLKLAEGESVPILRPGEGQLASAYHYIRRVHQQDNRPYAVIGIHIEGNIFNRVPDRFRSELAIPLLVSLPGVDIAKAHQTLTIGAAGVDVAELLGIRPNGPTAEVRRVFSDSKGKVIYLAEVVYRGDFVRLEMDLMK
ncbi:MAG: GntR family transcriptional regulator [Ferrovum sp. 37-45-19]|nr:MAG: GntR family transcriptional regulator [Ferrovum sp. 37-45-19]